MRAGLLARHLSPEAPVNLSSSPGAPGPAAAYQLPPTSSDTNTRSHSSEGQTSARIWRAPLLLVSHGQIQGVSHTVFLLEVLGRSLLPSQFRLVAELLAGGTKVPASPRAVGWGRSVSGGRPRSWPPFEAGDGRQSPSWIQALGPPSGSSL